MIKKKMRIISAAAALLLLCSCQSKEAREFDKNRALAEGKSGVVYRTTFFITHADEDKAEGIPYTKEIDGKLCYAYQNEDGDEVQLTPATLTDARSCYEVQEGIFLAPGTLGEKWGYVIVDTNSPDTETMNWNTDRIFDNAEAYTEGWSAASIDGLYGIVDLNGDFVVQPEYDAVKYVSFGVAPATKDGECFFINMYGEKVFGPFDDGESYAYGYAAVRKDGKWGFIDKSGNDATTFIYDEAYSVESNEETGELSAGTRTGDKWEKVNIRE